MKVFVIGTGTMGVGIAQVFAGAGWITRICDISDEIAQAGKKRIETSIAKLVKKNKITHTAAEELMGRISCTSDVTEAADCELVIEAAVESMEAKNTIFKKLDEICSKDCILASNTSSLSITGIASATMNPGRVIGLHFFNPAPILKLVEVIEGANTTPEVTKKTVEIAKSLGKEPVRVAETPGFVVNRLLIPMINEAAAILAEGVASAEDIDKAMILGASHPMGPLALSDLIGNDVSLAIMETILQETGDPKYRPCPLLRKMVRAGRLGRKTGYGFFKY